MGFVRKTPEGRFRACWRDPSGKQKSKSFRIKKEASAYLAEVEGSVNKGTYVDPHAGKAKFGQYAERWLASQRHEARTNERTASIMRAHVIPKWGSWPLMKIDHMTIQEWVTDLGKELAPATVAKCYGVVSMILRSAVRARLIALDPTEGVKLPSTHKAVSDIATISQEDFLTKLLPAVPRDHRALVCAAAGAGLRWGECVGLAWGSVDLIRDILRVVQVAEETSQEVRVRPYPKTRASVRTVPMAPFLVAALRAHLGGLDAEPDPRALVFGTRNATALRRSNFRRQVWRPALVRASLLGKVIEVGPDKWRATWPDRIGLEWHKEFTTERDAVVHVADQAAGGLRFHDLRHSYATWLVSAGVPINVVQKVMGHQQASTTLNRYTHAPDDYEDRVTAAFSGPAASLLPLNAADERDEADGEEEEGL